MSLPIKLDNTTLSLFNLLSMPVLETKFVIIFFKNFAIKIPIISIVDAQNNLVNITYPLIGDLTFNNLKFYYFFISRVLMIKKDKKDKKK